MSNGAVTPGTGSNTARQVVQLNQGPLSNMRIAGWLTHSAREEAFEPREGLLVTVDGDADCDLRHLQEAELLPMDSDVERVPLVPCCRPVESLRGTAADWGPRLREQAGLLIRRPMLPLVLLVALVSVALLRQAWPRLRVDSHMSDSLMDKQLFPPFMGGGLPGSDQLAPTDKKLGMTCPKHAIVHFQRLAGPWGLPLAMDGRDNPEGEKDLFNHHAQPARDKVRRVVIFYDLNYPQNTYCKMRKSLDDAGGEDVTLMTVGFPTVDKPRGLGHTDLSPCSPRWSRDYVWLSNRPAEKEVSTTCRHSSILPTPCELLLGLIGQLQTPEWPNLQDIRIMGFSAGGQLLDRCLYSSSRFGRWEHKQGDADVRFFIVSPSTLLYNVPERAVLKTLPEMDCSDFDPAVVLKRSYEFRIPAEHLTEMANMTRPPGWYCYKEKQEHHTVHWQKQQCEKADRQDDEYDYVFTKGDDTKAPGCQGCWCCRQRSDSKFQQRYACRNYNHYRYGFHGRMPPDMPEGHSCHVHDCSEEVRLSIRRSLLNFHAVYVGGSADVCNWRLQKRFEPKCGWCLKERSTYEGGMTAIDDSDEFARDKMSQVVDSCRAIWEGTTRLERMKIYKDITEKVVAPRVGVSLSELHSKRQFLTLVGAGHSDNTVVQMMAPCLAHDECDSDILVPMSRFDASGTGAGPPWGWPWSSNGKSAGWGAF